MPSFPPLLLLLLLLFLHVVTPFNPARTGGGRDGARMLRLRQHHAVVGSLSEKLAALNEATNGRQATRILSAAGAELWNTTRIVGGSRRMSPTEMKMLTKIDGDVAKKLGLNGDKDADRIAAALGAIVVGAMFSGVATAQFLPGPPIIRFCVVWLCAFSPYMFLTLGINLPSTMQWALVQTPARGRCAVSPYNSLAPTY